MASRTKMDKIWFFDVTEPQLHPNGFTIYRVTCKVFPINSPESLTETVTWKRYNDFKQLFKAMFSLHRALHRRDKFPEFAKPKLFGRFDNAVIEERRQSALRLLKFISEQPHLSNSLVLQKFLEGGKVSATSCVNKGILTPNRIDLLSSATHSTSQPPDILPIIISDQHCNSVDLRSPTEDNSTSSIGDPPSTNNGMDTLDVDSKPLEGTWNFPQIPDNISLGSSTGEDTDLDSTFGTPLKDSELAIFDPIKSDNTCDLVEGTNWFGDEQTHVNTSITSKDVLPDSIAGGASLSSSVRSSNENLLEKSFHGHGDNSFDLGEFDPLRNRSVSGVECGKGDIDLSNSSQKSGSINSIPSLPSTPKSGQSTPVLHSPAVKQRSNTQTSVSSLTATKGDYLVVAASQIGMAQECEVNGNFEMAFAYYKIGVDVLIQGVQADTDRYRQDAVRRKTAQYLMRAEEIYNKYLSKENLDDFRWAASSCISPNLELDPSFALIRGSISELRNYKVLGTIDNVILVMDKVSDETYVIKTVHKSSAALEQKVCLLPTSCPYMCNLLKFFETENAVHLLLQYASGGKLWNYIGAYLNSSSYSGFDECHFGTDSPSSKNVYAGIKLMSNKNENPKCDISTNTSENVKDFEIKDEIKTVKSTSFVNDEAILFSNLQNKDDNLTGPNICEVISIPEKLHKPKKRLSSFSSAELTFDENDSVLKSVSHDDQFDDVLTNTNQSLQYFTINSVDSSSDIYQRMDSNNSVSEHIGAIPEELSPSDEKTSSNTSPGTCIATEMDDDAFDCETLMDNKDAQNMDAIEIIRSSKALIKSVDHVLSDSFEKVIQKSRSLSPPDITNNVSHDSDEPSIYDVHKTSDDSSETSELDSKRISAEIINEPVSAIELSNKPSNLSGLQAICDIPVTHQSKQNYIIDASPQHKSIETKISKDSSSIHTGRKRTLSRLNSKTLTRSASFECDLKSPTKNRARAVSNLFDQLDAVEPEQVRLLESCIRQWAAEIVVAVSKLHHVGIICRDLNADNILLGDHGHVMLTYFSRLPQVDEVIKPQAADELYVAPEVLSVNGYDETCDWWSLGTLLYELLVGQTLLICHPGGINSHTNLYIPSHVSPEAKGLLQELLRYNPKERLGSCLDGVEAIKSHPFFTDIDWNAIEGVY